VLIPAHSQAVAFLSPPILKWKEPDAYLRDQCLIKNQPKAFISNSFIDVYEHQILRTGGRSVTAMYFNKLEQCTVTERKLPDETYYVLTLTPKYKGFWAFSFNFLKETAVADPVILEQFLDILRKHNIPVVDSRKP